MSQCISTVSRVRHSSNHISSHSNSNSIHKVAELLHREIRFATPMIDACIDRAVRCDHGAPMLGADGGL